MSDYAHEWTDERIERLSKSIKREYRAAAKEMRAVAKKRLADYSEQLAEAKTALNSGKITKEAYRAHLSTLAVAKARDRELVRSLTAISMTPRTSALRMIRDEVPQVYAECSNFSTFLIEKAARLDTAFTLVDVNMVKVLLDRVPNLLPTPNTATDVLWHTQKFASAITQSILIGDPVDKTASRLVGVLDMDYTAAVRSARTALTAAENMGRQESYERAEQIGIKGVKVWVATIDDRTRESHVQLDGEKVGIHEKFPNGLDEPGDPSGDSSEVYNCRCTTRLEVEGVEQEAVERFSRLPEGVSYEDWKRDRR